MAFARQLAWTAIGTYAGQAIMLGSAAILARLLAPADFGLVGMMTAFNALMLVVAQGALGVEIIQRQDLAREQLRQTAGIGLALGILSAGCLLVGAPLVARLIGDPRLEGMLQVAALGMLAASMSQVPIGLLKRERRFRTWAMINIASTSCASATAIVLAWLGFGHWALVWQVVLRQGIEMAAAHIASRSPGPRLPGKATIRMVWEFSAPVVAFQAINFLHRNLDMLVIGAVLGATAAGHYSRATIIMITINTAIGGVVAQTLHPQIARLEGRTSEIREAFASNLRRVLWASGAIMGAIACVPELVIRLAWGPNWGESADPLFWLALTGVHQGCFPLFGCAFYATRRTKALLAVGATTSAMFVATLVASVPHGIAACTMAYCACSALVLALSLGFIWTRLLSGDWASLGRLALPPILCCSAPPLAIHLARNAT